MDYNNFIMVLCISNAVTFYDIWTMQESQKLEA